MIKICLFISQGELKQAHNQIELEWPVTETRVFMSLSAYATKLEWPGKTLRIRDKVI